MRKCLPLGELQRARLGGIIELGLTQKTSQTLIPPCTLMAKRVLIVGGGLTSGHLAVGAISRGAEVHLIIRRQFSEKLFDAESGWLGPKCLKGFSAQSDWE
ncbi:hypothetical protein [Nostoc sp.]|uniref:hypothetical protein n=1 Tax=Nostoc sp. TaxID=1180 RepID=UPI003FA5D532